MAKYPRTPHLPFSPGGTNDDRRLSSISHFLNKQLIITEKMDGSNVCLESQNVFARSHASSPNHPSFDALKALHASVKHKIPDGIQIFGEWCYAKHSIEYSKLPSYLLIFGIRQNFEWLDWPETSMWADELEVETVPELSDPVTYANEQHMQRVIEIAASHKSSTFGGEREGIVVRLYDGFKDSDFGLSVAKWVRANHVQSDDHWKNQEIIRNKLNNV
jgi:hypothetical protein